MSINVRRSCEVPWGRVVMMNILMTGVEGLTHTVLKLLVDRMPAATAMTLDSIHPSPEIFTASYITIIGLLIDSDN